jgi:hypothetical protein
MARAQRPGHDWNVLSLTRLMPNWTQVSCPSRRATTFHLPGPEPRLILQALAGLGAAIVASQ